MKVSELSQWIGLLSVGKIDDGIARFGKKVGELAGRDLVSIEATDPRFAELALEYDPKDGSRLLFIDAKLERPEPVNHAQLTQRFGKPEPIVGPIDDFSGDDLGTYFVFSEGKERFSLFLYFQGKIEDAVEVSRVSLRRLVPLEFAGAQARDDEATQP